MKGTRNRTDNRWTWPNNKKEEEEKKEKGKNGTPFFLLFFLSFCSLRDDMAVAGGSVLWGVPRHCYSAIALLSVSLSLFKRVP